MNHYEGGFATLPHTGGVPKKNDSEAQRRLLEAGAAPEDVAQATRDQLVELSAVVALRPPGRPLTLSQLAERAGVGLPDLRRLWRAIGLADPGEGDPVATEADLRVVDDFQAAAVHLGPDIAVQLAVT